MLDPCIQVSRQNPYTVHDSIERGKLGRINITSRPATNTSEAAGAKEVVGDEADGCLGPGSGLIRRSLERFFTGSQGHTDGSKRSAGLRAR